MGIAPTRLDSCVLQCGALGAALFGQFWNQISVISEVVTQLEETAASARPFPFHSYVRGKKKNQQNPTEIPQTTSEFYSLLNV